MIFRQKQKSNYAQTNKKYTPKSQPHLERRNNEIDRKTFGNVIIFLLDINLKIPLPEQIIWFMTAQYDLKENKLILTFWVSWGTDKSWNMTY